ncbi:MAG: hypothetical protein R2852_08155 [Bacteroidia bacterium]
MIQFNMSQTLLNLLFLLPISLFLILGLFASKQINPERLQKLSNAIPLLAILIGVSSAYWIFQYGPIESSTLGFYGLGFSLRLDQLSLILFLMVSIIALVVLRFSFNYLDGDSNKSKFIGQLATTVALVQLLVLSGNIAILFLAWFATSMSLPNYYSSTPTAKRHK